MERVSARRRVATRFSRCAASTYICSLEDIDFDAPVVLYARSSTRGQQRGGNLDDQLSELRRAAGTRPVVGEYSEVANAAICNHSRCSLLRAICRARQMGAIVLAASRDRVLRHCDARQIDPANEKPYRYEYLELESMLDGVQIASVIDPDLPQSQVRSLQTKRGHVAKGNAGGRPRRDYQPRSLGARQRQAAVRMRIEGASLSEIAAELGRSRSTIFDWVRRLS